MVALAIVNHIQYPAQTGGIVYCHLLDRIVDWTPEHYYGNCCGDARENGEPCPYAVGRGYDGSGIENQFWDPTFVPFDPVETITTEAQVRALFRRTRGLEKKTGLEEDIVTTGKEDTAQLSTLSQLARAAFKQTTRTKWEVGLDGRKKGVVYLGGDVPFEITTQDADLERLAMMMVTNPIESSAGTSKIGEENFPEVAQAFFRESGYELKEIQ